MTATGRRGFLAGAASAAAMPLPRLLRAQPAAGPSLTAQMRVLPIDDPRLFDWSEKGNIARGMVEPLVRYSQDGRLVPWLAEAWQVAPDARSVRLTLRAGARWSNGDPFTAADVAHNVRRWCEADVPGNSMATRMAALIDPATGRMAEDAIETPDARTVVLRLRYPDVTLVPGMADYPALIVHPGTAAAGGLAAAPVGTGPFALESFAAGSHAVLRRRGAWWGGGVALERIEYRDLGTDPNDHLAAFEAGEIDMTYDTSPFFLSLFDAAGLIRREVLSAATLVARLNRRTGPAAYVDARLRRAVALAVDNAVILELGYGGLGRVADDTHVGPMHPDHRDIGAAAADPARALALATEAGAAGLTHELISADDDWTRASADAVAAQMLDAGLTVRRRILGGAAFWADWRSHPFSVTAWNMRPLGVQVLALAYSSGGAWNETGFASAEFDDTLARALAERDHAARAAPVAALQRLLRADGAIVQPFWRRLFLHHARHVQGVHRHPMNEHHHDLWSVAG